MDKPSCPVQGPVHSLCITSGDCGRRAHLSSTFVVPTVWRDKKNAFVSKLSSQDIADRTRARHAFLVDQREWDYGARLPRERSAQDSWTPTNRPENPDSSADAEPGATVWGTGSPADTGSMQPIPEAVAWSLRADAWAQSPETPSE